MKKIIVLSGLISFCSYASQGQVSEETQAYKYLEEAQKLHNSCRHLILDFQDHKIRETPTCELSGTLAEGISYLGAALIAIGIDGIAKNFEVETAKEAALAIMGGHMIQRFLYNQLYLKRSPQGVLTKVNALLADNENSIDTILMDLIRHSDDKKKKALTDHLKACQVVVNGIKQRTVQYPLNPYIKNIERRCANILQKAELQVTVVIH